MRRIICILLQLLLKSVITILSNAITIIIVIIIRGWVRMRACVCVRACVRVCVRACVRTSVYACVITLGTYRL